jgi:hypothetical protein
MLYLFLGLILSILGICWRVLRRRLRPWDFLSLHVLSDAICDLCFTFLLFLLYENRLVFVFLILRIEYVIYSNLIILDFCKTIVSSGSDMLGYIWLYLDSATLDPATGSFWTLTWTNSGLLS